MTNDQLTALGKEIITYCKKFGTGHLIYVKH